MRPALILQALVESRDSQCTARRANGEAPRPERTSEDEQTADRVELGNAIFEYLEIFHNRQRRHSALGMLTPIEFENRNQPTTAA